MTHSARTIAELLERHGLTPTRTLGQNFVIDPNTVRRIAQLAAVGPDDRVIEIGAGLGSLTLALIETGAAVTAIEIDRNLIPVLTEVLAGTEARILHADALSVDWPTQIDGPEGVVVVANLPYNVGTSIVLDVLERAPEVSRLLVMVQREVADRLVAAPGSRTYGIPSVKLAFWARAEIVGRVPPSVFLPKPKVDSALVAIERHGGAAVDDAISRRDAVERDALFALIDRAFGQRRKMLRRSLSPEFTAEHFVRANIDGQRRPESLALDEWIRLAAASPRP